MSSLFNYQADGFKSWRILICCEIIYIHAAAVASFRRVKRLNAWSNQARNVQEILQDDKVPVLYIYSEPKRLTKDEICPSLPWLLIILLNKHAYIVGRYLSSLSGLIREGSVSNGWARASQKKKGEQNKQRRDQRRNENKFQEGRKRKKKK